jgi:histidyl-tRNA synthetase
LDKLDKIGPKGVDAELANRGIEEQARNALLQVFLQDLNGGDSLARVAVFVTGDEAGTASRREPAGNHWADRADKCGWQIEVRSKVLPAGCRTTRAPSWRSTSPTSRAAWAAVDDTTTSWECFSARTFRPAAFRSAFERILVVMTERSMFPPTLATTPGGRHDCDVRFLRRRCCHAPCLRRCGKAACASSVYPDAEKIGKQIKYADSRGIPFVALLGEDEINAGTVTVKNLSAQTQATYDQSAAGAAIREGLKQRG